MEITRKGLSIRFYICNFTIYIGWSKYRNPCIFKITLGEWGVNFSLIDFMIYKLHFAISYIYSSNESAPKLVDLGE